MYIQNDYSALEEFDIIRNIKYPYLLHKEISPIVKKNTAYNILSRKAEEVLLISETGFCEEDVLAGLSEGQIEYIAKYGPREYKENIINTFSNANSISEIKEIIGLMDEDSDKGTNPNQQRMKNVMRYIYDNRTVFQF
jgi:hypothetical protein